jgi:hypothetical protein
MSAAERAKKKRARATLFPEQHAEKLAKDSDRKRSACARADIEAAADAQAADAEVDDAAELSRIKAFLLEKYGVQPDDVQKLVDSARGSTRDDSDSESVLETGFSAGTGDVGAGATRELAANRAAVLSLGLPHFTVPYRSCELIPQTLYEQKFAEEPKPPVSLVARILDGWSGSKEFRKHLVSWLEDMCFSFVDVDDKRAQIGASCGYVAARGINLMFAAADSMMAVDLSDAMDEKWIRLGNSVLQNGSDGAEYLETQQVYQLIEAFREHDSSPGKYLYTGTPIDEKIPFRPIPAPDPQYPHACMQWPVTVGSSDWVARKIAEAVMKYVNTQQQNWEQHLFVMNTQESGRQGSHWIAIGIEMKRMFFEGRTGAGHSMYGYGAGRKRPLGAIGT